MRVKRQAQGQPVLYYSLKREDNVADSSWRLAKGKYKHYWIKNAFEFTELRVLVILGVSTWKPNEIFLKRRKKKRNSLFGSWIKHPESYVFIMRWTGDFEKSFLMMLYLSHCYFTTTVIYTIVIHTVTYRIIYTKYIVCMFTHVVYKMCIMYHIFI